MNILPTGSLEVPAVVLAGFLLSIAMEKLVQPFSAGWRRPWPGLMIHSGLWLLAWFATFLILRRPVFAALAVLAGQFLVVQVNNAKYRALREPFLFSDFGIFSQTIKHPRLYLPFLGVGRALLVACAVMAAAAFGWFLESPSSDFLRWTSTAALAGTVLVAAGLLTTSRPTLDPVQDIARQGLFATMAQYWLREKTTQPARRTGLPTIRRQQPDLPDVVVIQSESFFDARRLFAGVKQDILAEYDKACAGAATHGQLTVPAWGANTMRPEFAFLSGLNPESLDIHQFNPYRRIAGRPLRALPSVLGEAGYSTTCIHPHPARFFRRDRAFPNMGFNRFIDIRDFPHARKHGPYIGDEAVTDKLLTQLEESTAPSFFFVITMENHGPLHLEEVSTREEQEFYQQSPPGECKDLTVYLRHLRNADRQLGRLRRELAQRARPTILCFYGEHLPSMPNVYDALGMPDGRTDYFLEVPTLDVRVPRDIAVWELSLMLLEALQCNR
jgi:hypothetical protein